MQRRIQVLSQSSGSARNRLARIGKTALDFGWSCYSGKPHENVKHDVVWVLDPIRASEISRMPFRVLVWDMRVNLVPKNEEERMRREAGAMILKHCANLIIDEQGEATVFHRDSYGLDLLVNEEICDDILSMLPEIEEE